MRDDLGRDLSYLRISVTDRCNLRCRYCMPAEGVSFVEHSEILSYEEIMRLVRIAAPMGIRRIRLTGGEPLVRQGLAELVRGIKQIEGIDFVGMTTNAVLLEANIHDLELAGLDAVNISLDTLDRERYAAITGRDVLDRALAGLDAALSLL
ncbi:MAG: radical SAM protein [Clostridiaceae bacterium]|nr:radical SAM protein [Clostridiaceae bacterium]